MKNVRDGVYLFKNKFVQLKYSVNMGSLSSSKNTHCKKDDDHKIDCKTTCKYDLFLFNKKGFYGEKSDTSSRMITVPVNETIDRIQSTPVASDGFCKSHVDMHMWVIFVYIFLADFT